MKLLLDAPYWVRFIIVNLYGFYLSRKRFNKTYKVFREKIDANLKKNKEEILEDQFGLLKSNLIYCYENILYYKNTFDQVDFNPYEMISANELEKIPFLTKKIIRENKDKLYNKNIPKSTYNKHYTSGSTGQKLEFFIPKKLLFPINAAFIYRFYSFLGISPKDKRVTIGGRVFTNKAPYWLYNYFENQLLLSSHHLNNDTVQSYINKINKFKPVFIQGHPNSIIILARFLIKNRVKINFKLKGIFTTGETLVESDRKIIESAFNTIVLQQYGSGESVFSSQESISKNGYLLNYEHGYVELIGDGELKEVVVTSFLNDVMPFVRYKIGDYAKGTDLKDLDNLPLPVVFKEVIGRVDDLLYDTKGNPILPVTIRMLIKPFLVFGSNYQLIQKDDTNYQLIIVDKKKEINFTDFLIELKNLLGKEALIEVTYTNSLITSGGKVRNIINKQSK